MTVSQNSALDETLLEVQGLVTHYATREANVIAVDGVSLAVSRGEMLGLVGESGCGKSATIRSILGLLRPPGVVAEGKVVFKGQDLRSLPAGALRQIRGSAIGFVPQSPFSALNPMLSVGTQFRNVIKAHRAASAAECHDMAAAILSEMGLAAPRAVLAGYPHELSGGMAQRVVIAMSLVLNPDLLIADEPTTALDVTKQRQILDLLSEAVRSTDRGALLVTHSLGVVNQYCDRVAVMYAGRIVEEGPVDRVLRSPSHPYTAALLASVPRPGRQLTKLQGEVPQITRKAAGCSYRHRCSSAVEICASHSPELGAVAPSHHVACHNSNQG